MIHDGKKYHTRTNEPSRLLCLLKLSKISHAPLIHPPPSLASSPLPIIVDNFLNHQIEWEYSDATPNPVC